MNRTDREVDILIADDDEDLLDMLALTLTKAGFRVCTSIGGSNIEALISERRPDIILLDIQMGEIDGSELCSQLKRSGLAARIPILLISANHDIHQRAQVCSADGFLSKPFSGLELIEFLKQYLSGQN